MARRRRTQSREFRPDPSGRSLLKLLHMTEVQRRQWLQWGLYVLVCLAALIVQDVIMSRVRFSGATTDLVACAIILIAVTEGADRGGLFALLASVVYFYTGSAPGAYVIALLTAVSIFAALIRQSYWTRGFASTMLCAGAALLVYEMGLFAVGLFLRVTIWERVGVALLTGLMTLFLMAALYPLIVVISKIGGESWKE